MMRLSDEEFAELAAKHGGDDAVARVETAAGTLVFRRPTRAEFRRATAKGLLDSKAMFDALEPLARDCVVHPTRAQFEAMIEARPALPLACANALLNLAGLTGEEEARKS